MQTIYNKYPQNLHRQEEKQSKYVPLEKVHVYVNLEIQIKILWRVGDVPSLVLPTLSYFPIQSCKYLDDLV